MPASKKKPTKKKDVTPKQRMFALEYLIDHNGTQAAIRAGYSAKTAEQGAAQLLSNIKVKALIDELEQEAYAKLGITKEWVLREQAKIAGSSIDNHVKIGEDGFVQAKPFEEMPPEAIAAIRTIEEKRRTLSTPSGDVILESTFKFSLHDKVSTLRDIGKHLGMYKDELEVTGGPFVIVKRDYGEAGNDN